MVLKIQVKVFWAVTQRGVRINISDDNSNK
jgi:hypothetical protein